MGADQSLIIFELHANPFVELAGEYKIPLVLDFFVCPFLFVL